MFLYPTFIRSISAAVGGSVLAAKAGEDSGLDAPATTADAVATFAMNPRLVTSLLSFDWRERDETTRFALPATKADEPDRLASKMHVADRGEDTMVD